ncbi:MULTISPECIES: phage late control D family protein, partial [unclassified Caballeronia]
TLDGRDLSRQIAPKLISLTLSESRAEESDTLDLVIDDSKNTFAIPKRGANIRVAIGWVGESLVDKGVFTVDEIEHSGAPDIITIRARSASMTHAMHERREQSWHGQTLGAIVRTIASRHSLKAAVSEVLASVAIAHIDQTHESDMSFLTRLARRFDAVMNVKDLHLLFMPIGTGKTASGRALAEVTLTRKDGDSHRYHVAQRESYSAVRAHWHSNGAGKRRSVVIGGENNRNVKVLPEDYASEPEARAAAKAEYARVQRSQATMDYTLARGRAEVFPELPVTIKGFKPEIDDTPWLVKRVVHTLTGDAGFATSIELEVRDDPASKRHRSHFSRRGRQ